MYNNKKVVVVLPAYNAEKTLEQTLREVPMDIVDELILVDDASKDDTFGKAKAVNIDTSIKPINAFFNLFTSKSYNIERFYSTAFEQKIAATIAAKNFDFILLEGIYLMRYIDIIRRNTKAVE